MHHSLRMHFISSTSETIESTIYSNRSLETSDRKKKNPKNVHPQSGVAVVGGFKSLIHFVFQQSKIDINWALLYNPSCFVKALLRLLDSHNKSLC